MSRWKILDTWDRDLPGLTEEQLADRLRLATDYERWSNARGSGRAPKARRAWRLRREAVEAEIAQRTDQSDT